LSDILAEHRDSIVQLARHRQGSGFQCGPVADPNAGTGRFLSKTRGPGAITPVPASSAIADHDPELMAVGAGVRKRLFTGTSAIVHAGGREHCEFSWSDNDAGRF
jgi:hypothetical protein